MFQNRLMINYLYFPYDIEWLNLLTFTFFILSIATLWLKNKLWLIFYALTLICGIADERIRWIALVPIGLLGTAFYIRQESLSKKSSIILDILILIIAFGLMEHLWPGFRNWKILSGIQLSENAVPYTLYLNLDKPVVGLFFISALVSCFSWKDWKEAWKYIGLFSAVTIPVLLFFSWVLGYVTWDPKFPNITPLWMVVNLFLTCIAEEAFYRGFIQNRLSEMFKKYSWGMTLSILIAAILFGLDHYTGGYNYIILATIAGLFYGSAFALTRRIEVSILTHFILNLTHFLLFTYPAIK